MAELGAERRYTARELRSQHTGRNFRATAPLLAAENGTELEPAVLDRWVDIEQAEVSRHLGCTLRPDPEVTRALQLLSAAFPLAVVSSSGSQRVRTCLAATGLTEFVAADRLFSAEDSLAHPVSKPDPAIYSHAGFRMGVAGDAALAVEDSETGVRAAVAAGIPVVGLLHFAPPDDAAEIASGLRTAGAAGVFDTWDDLVASLLTMRQAVGRDARESSG